MKSLTDTFYHAHKNTVLALAADYFPNPEDAADAAQETFTKLMMVRKFIPDDVDQAGAWVYTVVDNFLKDLRRKESRRLRLSRCLDYEADEAIDFEDPLSYNERQEAASYFMVNYGKLEEPYRSTFMLRYEDGLSYEAIADKTGVAVGTVSSRIARAKEMVLT